MARVVWMKHKGGVLTRHCPAGGNKRNIYPTSITTGQGWRAERKSGKRALRLFIASMCLYKPLHFITHSHTHSPWPFISSHWYKAAEGTHSLLNKHYSRGKRISLSNEIWAQQSCELKQTGIVRVQCVQSRAEPSWAAIPQTSTDQWGPSTATEGYRKGCPS